MAEAVAAREEALQTEAVKAGRGVLVIAFAKVYFMIAGAAIEIALARLLSQVMYGMYRSVMNIVSPINNVIVTGTIQAVSKFTSEDDTRAAAVQRAGLRAHLVLGTGVALLYFALGGVIARTSKDPGITNLLRISAGVVFCYSFYAVFVGTANGKREFTKQAGLDILFATLRASMVVGAAALGLGARGSLIGFVIAAASILTVASIVVGLWRTEKVGVFPTKRVLFFLGTVALYAAVMNLVMFIDQLLLKPIITHRFADLGKELAAKAGNLHVAHYSAVQNLARLSYQAILAVTFVIFPLVSRSTFEKDETTTKNYIAQTLRYALIFATALGVVLGSNATALLSVPYKPEYREGGPAMMVLAYGNVAFAVLTIAGTILNGAGKTGWALGVAILTLGLAAGGNALIIPRVDPGADVLMACAAATSIAMVIGCIASGILIYRTYGAFIPAKTLARVGLAVGVCMGVARVIPEKSKIMTLAESALIGLVFLGVLIATRELGKADVDKFARVLRKKKS